MGTFDDYRIHFGGEMSDEKAESVVDRWRGALQAATGRSDIELAAAFQRHFLQFGTGLPSSICLALTASEALCFKFNARNSAHPMNVTPRQVGRQVAAWKRSELRVAHLEPGRLAIGVVFEISTKRGKLVLRCRTPRLAVNPAATVMITTLGGELAD